MPPLDASPLPLTGLRKLAAETDGSVDRTRQFVLEHGCRIIQFAGAECVVVTDIRRLMRALVTKAGRRVAQP
jgi:hypothetical protein